MDTADNLNHRSMLAILAPALSLLALMLCIPPIAWHLSNRNWGASFLVAFVIYSDIINIINALIWPTDDVESWWNGYGYCDVQVKLSIASQVGMPGALLCIFRSLAIVMDVDNAALVPTRAQRLRNKAFNVIFCIGLPVLAMIAHFVVQGGRYYIFAITGCNASFDQSWPTIALSFAWPPVICIGAACYCVLIIVRLVKYKSEFSTILGESRNKLSSQRFTRLFGLSALMILIILPLQTFVFYTNIIAMIPLQPYSWKTLHGAALGTITKVQTHGTVKYDRWIPSALSVLIFAFFGLGQDAANMYRSFLNVVGLKKFPSSSSSRGASFSYEGKLDSWYDSLRSKSNSWLLGSRRTSKGTNAISVSSSHTNTTMSGGLDGDTLTHAAGSRVSASSPMHLPTPGSMVVGSIHPKDDCNV
ncbi:hypothetical protein UA08_07017 [Talaromyces atroroseus]|uniref:Pheromone a factor receptor n=1 Tax=Talaromyces atroroseus TaxID=1441469 RepID=A0A225A9M2_TALAT|nr:hypothetical protein UA08_07017 [Talaromyces atroroseus]OKL57581.1 hypothetical protein UA08_07017 [Talaromyces atroroseus]